MRQNLSVIAELNMPVLRGTVIFLLLVGVKSQQEFIQQPGRPEACDRPAEFMYRQCCVFPPFFTREVAKACGAIFQVNFIDKTNNITGFTRQANIEGCTFWRCILKKYGFITAGDFLDEEKYFVHLDEWAKLNLSFTKVIKNAQVHCKNIYQLFLPLSVCEFHRMHGCIRNFVNVDCPELVPSEKCIEKKKFYEECREYFL